VVATVAKVEGVFASFVFSVGLKSPAFVVSASKIVASLPVSDCTIISVGE
jgi:hypothetical protein